jgi:ADP-heptose:LPS heptosyltransferase
VNPFSGRLIKDWPIDHYATLIDTLRRRTRTKVIMFGDSPAMQDTRRAALAGIPGVVDLGADLSLDFMIDQLVEADLYIGNDSGTTHLAAHLGVPTVAIMSGDVDPGVWRPLGASVVVLKSDVPCAPCELNSLALCPVSHLCMQTIPPEAVLAAADDLLGGGGNALGFNRRESG